MGINIHLKTKNWVNCLHIAAKNGHLNLRKTLFKQRNFDVQVTDLYGWTALHESVANGIYNLFEFLTDQGTDIQMKTKKRTKLSSYCSRKWTFESLQDTNWRT